MSFIAKYITHRDETLVYLARLHWIYLIKGIMWFTCLSFAGIYLNWQFLVYVDELPSKTAVFLPPLLAHLLDYMVGLIPVLTGLLILLIYIFKMIGTEVALTNKRLIYKTGVFLVQSHEVEIAEISEIRVDNGLLGTLLNYGSMALDCRFVGDFALPVMNRPYNLLRQINKLRGLHQAQHNPEIIPAP